MISATMFRDSTVRELTAEEAEQKRAIYEKMAPRRRKFIDRIGYDEWDPFQKPNDPMELRTEISGRTAHQLMREFMRSHPNVDPSGDYGRGALQCALGVITKDEKILGTLDFCVWYHQLLVEEGHTDEE